MMMHERTTLSLRSPSDLSCYDLDPRKHQVPLLLQNQMSAVSTIEQPSSYHPQPAPSVISIAPTVTTFTGSSIITDPISTELITTRLIWPKILLILLFLFHLATAWLCIASHGLVYDDQTPIEIGVSLGSLLICGHLLIGLINAYVYAKRLKIQGVKKRSKHLKENKEAWLMARVTFTILGMAPIGRYIESFRASKRMVTAEKSILSQAPILEKDHLSLRKLRRARRQFMRCEEDSAMIALASGVFACAPFTLLQGFLLFRRQDMLNTMSTRAQISILLNFIASVLWMAATLCHFYPVRNATAVAKFESGTGSVSIFGLTIFYFARVVHVTMRLLCLGLFLGLFRFWIFLPLGLQWLSVLVIQIAFRHLSYRNAVESSGLAEPNLRSYMEDVMTAFVGMYEFVNGGLDRTRIRYLIYYFIYYGSNVAMIVIWYVNYPLRAVWYYFPALMVISISQIGGFILLQIYLAYFVPEKRSSSICGFCCLEDDYPESVNQHYTSESLGSNYGGDMTSNHNESVIFGRSNQQVAKPAKRSGAQSSLSSYSNQNLSLSRYNKGMPLTPLAEGRESSRDTWSNPTPSSIAPSSRRTPITNNYNYNEHDFRSRTSPSRNSSARSSDPRRNHQSYPNNANDRIYTPR